MMHRTTSFSTARTLTALAIATSITALMLGNGCGSRGPLDEAPITISEAGSADDANADGTTSPPSSLDAAPDGPPPGSADAGRDASPLGCGICLVGQCSQDLLSCLSSTGCRTVFQCVASKCLGLGGLGGDGGGGGGGGGGGLNPLCLFGCAGNDPAAALQLLSIFQCVTGKCGSDCGSLLGGLGNLPGGGGGGGGGGPGGGGGKGPGKDFSPSMFVLPNVPAFAGAVPVEDQAAAFQEAFSAWPELISVDPRSRP